MSVSSSSGLLEGAAGNSKFIGGTMMKKTFAMILAACLMLSVLAGCGSKKEETPAE